MLLSVKAGGSTPTAGQLPTGGQDADCGVGAPVASDTSTLATMSIATRTAA